MEITVCAEGNSGNGVVQLCKLKTKDFKCQPTDPTVSPDSHSRGSPVEAQLKPDIQAIILQLMQLTFFSTTNSFSAVVRLLISSSYLWRVKIQAEFPEFSCLRPHQTN